MTKKSRIPVLAEFRLSILAGFAALALTLFACSNFDDSEEHLFTQNDSEGHLFAQKKIHQGISPDAITLADIKYWVGQGPDSAMFVVQWNDELNPDGLVWGYLFDSSDASQNKGINMILAIAKADPRFFALIYNTSGVDHNQNPLGTAVGGLGYDLNKDHIFNLILNSNIILPDPDGLFITNAYNFDDYINGFPGIDHWQSGWFTNGYWSYWVADTLADTVKWEYSNWGASTRQLKNNSVDAWYFDIDAFTNFDNSTFYRCMLQGEDCNGKEFFDVLHPVKGPRHHHN